MTSSIEKAYNQRLTPLMVTIAGKKQATGFRPCPFCHSTQLRVTEWWGDDGEFDAVECCECNGSAPADRWNHRGE